MIKFQCGIKLLILSLVFLLPACDGKNLNSLEGPKSGKVSGLLCNDLQVLLTAREQEVVRNVMLEHGKCIDVKYAKKVKVARTIMMPTDGKYSQVLWPKKDEKYWVRTDEIK